MNHDVFTTDGTWIALIHVKDGDSADETAKRAFGDDVYTGVHHNTTCLAEFVEEGLAGLGIMDDADEIIFNVFDDCGEVEARAAMLRYNNAFTFVNKTLDKDYSLITEEDFADYTSE